MVQQQKLKDYCEQTCTLFHNELPLRTFFRKLDDVTNEPTSFNGALGQRCSDNIHEELAFKNEDIETPIKDEIL